MTPSAQIRRSGASDGGYVSPADRMPAHGSAPAAQTYALGQGANRACGPQSPPQVVIELLEDTLVASVMLEACFSRRNDFARILQVWVCMYWGWGQQSDKWDSPADRKETSSTVSLDEL
ncbi:hypothetical protein MRX96_025697 [Rhipicephalus microplus]